MILKKYNFLLDFTKFAAKAVVCGNVLMIFWKNFMEELGGNFTEALKSIFFNILIIR
jgi:hypothetical protein